MTIGGYFGSWYVQYNSENEDVLVNITLMINHGECKGCYYSTCEYCDEDFSDKYTTYIVKNSKRLNNSDKWSIRFEKEYKNFDEAFEEFNKQVKLGKEELIKNGY